mmetsp:Transcript_24302/g.75946  ORF Transcript_24302/g.75946 Transcript_24302/m.75946 type:complete len:323 (-) Transcript_24302:59-1027(-)
MDEDIALGLLLEGDLVVEAEEAADSNHDPEEEEGEGGVVVGDDAGGLDVGGDVGGGVDLAADEPEDGGAEDEFEGVLWVARGARRLGGEDDARRELVANGGGLGRGRGVERCGVEDGDGGERRVLREELAGDELDERDEGAGDGEADRVRAEPGPGVHAVDLSGHDLAARVKRGRAHPEEEPGHVEDPDVLDEGHVQQDAREREQDEDHDEVPGSRRAVEPRRRERARHRARAARDEHRADARRRRPAVGRQRRQRRPEGDQHYPAHAHRVRVRCAPPESQVRDLARLDAGGLDPALLRLLRQHRRSLVGGILHVAHLSRDE